MKKLVKEIEDLKRSPELEDRSDRAYAKRYRAIIDSAWNEAINSVLSIINSNLTDIEVEVKIEENKYWLDYINRFESHVTSRFRRVNRHNFLDRIQELKELITQSKTS